MTAGGCQHTADIVFGDGATGKIDVGDETLAAETPAGHRHHDRLQLHAGHAFGDVDRLADRLLGLDQIDDRAAFHAAGCGVGKANRLTP